MLLAGAGVELGLAEANLVAGKFEGVGGRIKSFAAPKVGKGAGPLELTDFVPGARPLMLGGLFLSRQRNAAGGAVSAVVHWDQRELPRVLSKLEEKRPLALVKVPLQPSIPIVDLHAF